MTTATPPFNRFRSITRWGTLSAVLAALVVATLLVLPSHGAAAATTEEVELRGVVNVNGEPARSGTVISFIPAGSSTPCVAVATTGGGNFVATLDDACAQTDGELLAALERVPEKNANDPIRLDSDQDALAINFQLTDEEIARLYGDAATSDEGAAGQVLVQQATSVFEELEGVSLWLLAATAFVLLSMVLGMTFVTHRRYEFATTVWDGLRRLSMTSASQQPDESGTLNGSEPSEAPTESDAAGATTASEPSEDSGTSVATAQDSGERSGALAPLPLLDGLDGKSLLEAIKMENTSYQRRLGVFRWMVEGMVMSFVVVTVLALGASGKISDEGIVSILAALVGYAAGRVSSSGS